MAGSESNESRSFEEENEIRFLLELDPQRTSKKQDLATPKGAYAIELGGQAIHLDFLEFEILRFISKKPYKAFTRKQICDAVRTVSHPIDESTIDRHVKTLRDKLGMFSDYVQSVPYVGYRFKA